MLAACRFHFRPVLTMVVGLAFAILLMLGNWQLQRLEWKRELIANIEARTNAPPISYEEAVQRASAGEGMEYTPVSITGTPIKGSEAMLFGTYDGAPGAYLFAAFQTDPEIVYVNQGFVPQVMLKQPDFGWRANEKRSVVGFFRYAEDPSPPASWLKTKGKSVDGFWHIRDPESFAQDANLETWPFYIDEFAVAGREWPKGGTTRLQFNNRHLEYALTWFGLAATLIAVWIAFSLQKREQ